MIERSKGEKEGREKEYYRVKTLNIPRTFSHATRARNAAGTRRNSGGVAPSVEVNFNQDSIDLKGLNELAEIIF